MRSGRSRGEMGQSLVAIGRTWPCWGWGGSPRRSEQRRLVIRSRFSWDASGCRGENVGKMLVAQCPHRMSSLPQRHGASGFPGLALCLLHSHCWGSGLSSHWSFSCFLSPLGFNSFKMAKGLLWFHTSLAAFLAEPGEVLAFAGIGPLLCQPLREEDATLPLALPRVI